MKRYRVEWSRVDKVFVATVDEFPLLAAHGASEDEALNEIKLVVKYIEEEDDLNTKK